MTLFGFVNQGDKMLRDAVLQAMCQIVHQGFGSELATEQGDFRKPLLVHSALGPIPLFPWWHADEQGKPEPPAAMGLLSPGCTVAVQEQITALYALVPVAEVAFSMHLFVSCAPSKSTIHRVAVKESNATAEEFSCDLLSTLLNEQVAPIAEQVELISRGADGGHVPMRGEDETAQRQWHGGRVVTVTLLSRPDAERPRKITLFEEDGTQNKHQVGHERPILAKIVLGQMPTLAGPCSERVENAMKYTYEILSKLCPQANWQGVCDGGDWPEQLVDATIGTKRRTTDCCHASAHLLKVARCLHTTEGQAKGWWARQYNALMTQKGQADQLAQELQAQSDARSSDEGKIESAGYFIKRAENMQYAERIADDELIASGHTEAGVKQAISVRMKRSGATLTHSGGDAVMHVRGLIISDLCPSAWREHCANKNHAILSAA